MAQKSTVRVPYLASAALPGSGAYTTTTTPARGLDPRQAGITAWISYTRGGSGGYPVFRVLWGNGTDEDHRLAVVNSSLTESAPNGTQALFLSVYKGPVPADETAIKYVASFTVPPGATTFHMLVAEEGATSTPGTCAIHLTGVLDT